MRPNNITDPFDPLVCADVQHTDQPINVCEESRRIGFHLEDGDWFTSKEPRQTDHCCRRIITNLTAGIGEICRLELYPNRNNPQHGLIITYQILSDTRARLRAHNRFFSNDPIYKDNHSNRFTEKLRSATREEIHREMQRFLLTDFS